MLRSRPGISWLDKIDGSETQYAAVKQFDSSDRTDFGDIGATTRRTLGNRRGDSGDGARWVIEDS